MASVLWETRRNLFRKKFCLHVMMLNETDLKSTLWRGICCTLYWSGWEWVVNVRCVCSNNKLTYKQIPWSRLFLEVTWIYFLSYSRTALYYATGNFIASFPPAVLCKVQQYRTKDSIISPQDMLLDNTVDYKIQQFGNEHSSSTAFSYSVRLTEG